MTVYDFIFTTKRPERYLRHVVFWVAQSVFWIVWAGIFFVEFKKWIAWSWIHVGGVTMLLEMVYTYLVAYYLLPMYFVRKKYITFSLLLFVFSLFFWLLFGLNIFFSESEMMNASNDKKLLMGWFFTMNFMISGPPVVCAMFLTVKMLKSYFTKLEEKRMLAKENAQAELQMLKAQIHPHFLFNTLNNIYSFALTASPDAGSLVLKLTDTLRYMINDCEADLVPLEKEIQLIRNYVGLEKVRYGNRLQLDVDVSGNPENKMIAPLLMIPFVENSFKHGASMLRGKQWIQLELTIQDKWLYFLISNSKPVKAVSQNGKEGIGLMNVQKRLQLIYPGRHDLKIESTNDVFMVRLQIALEEQPIAPDNDNPIVHAQASSYA